MLKKIILLSTLLLVTGVLSYSVWFYWLGRNIDLSYASSDLGIVFDYQPITDNGEIVLIKESENKVYVFTNKDGEENSAYVEVVNLDKTSDIQESMQAYVRKHFQNDDCFQVYNMQGNYEIGAKWQLVCGSTQGALRHQNYFLYDQNNPNKFVFFNIDFMGKGGLISSKNWAETTGGEFWFNTILME